MIASASKGPLLHAVLWTLGAVLALTAMAVAGRALAVEVSIFEIMVFRNAICLVVLSLLVPRVGLAALRTRRIGLHIGRNLVHFGAQAGWYFGLIFLPLAELFAIEFTTPIWTAILAALFIGERITRARGLGILLGFLGIVVILRPGIAIVDPASLAVLGAAVGFAATFVITRALTSSETAFTIIFYMNLVQLPLSLGLAASDWVWPSSALWPWVAVVGMAGLASHYCFARAFALAEASVVAPIDFARLPLGILLGVLLYGEAFEPFVIAGAVLVLAGNAVTMRSGARAGTDG